MSGWTRCWMQGAGICGAPSGTRHGSVTLGYSLLTSSCPLGRCAATLLRCQQALAGQQGWG